MVCDRRWKYIHAVGFRPMLFDLANDPERIPRPRRRSGAMQAERDRLAAALAQWGLRLSQRTTLSDARSRRMRGKAQRRGILIGVWDEVDIPDELWSGIRAREPQPIRSAARLSSGEETVHARPSLLLSALDCRHARDARPAVAQAQVGDSRSASSFPSRPAARATALARLIADKMHTCAQPSGHRREPHRRRRTHRRAGGEDRGARRQHAADDADRADGDLPARLQVARLRSDPRLRADVAARNLRFRRRRRAAGSREVAQGTGRLG